MSNVLNPIGTPAKVTHRKTVWGATADKFIGAYCEDNKRRIVKITGEPTTFSRCPLD